MTALPLPLIEHDPETRIIEEVRAGNTSAYGQLVERYWERIFARVLRLVGNREDAEEVTQDAFVRAFRSLDQFRGHAAFSTWVFQIATNLAHNRYWYWKRRGRGRSVSVEETLGNGDYDLTLQDVLPGDTLTPADAVDRNEFFTAIDRAIPELPNLHREILELRLHQDMSYEEIADHLEISVGTVKSRIARARDHLRGAVCAV